MSKQFSYSFWRAGSDPLHVLLAALLVTGASLALYAVSEAHKERLLENLEPGVTITKTSDINEMLLVCSSIIITSSNGTTTARCVAKDG